MGEAAVLAAAASAAALAFFLIDAFVRRAASRGAARRLEAFAGGREAELPVSSRAFQIRLALPWAPPGREEEAFLLFRLGAAGLGGLLPLAFGIPPLAALAGAAVGFMAAGEMIRGRFDRMVREIEEELPVFLERLAAVLQIRPQSNQRGIETMAKAGLRVGEVVAPQSNQRGIETRPLLRQPRLRTCLNRTSVGLKPSCKTITVSGGTAPPQSNQRGIETNKTRAPWEITIFASIEPAWD